MSSRRGNDMAGSHQADPSVKKNLESLDEESKAEFLKRVAKESRTQKAGNKVADEWFEVIGGHKLVKKMRKSNGGVYSIYVGNVKSKKNPKAKEFLKTLKKGADGKLRA